MEVIEFEVEDIITASDTSGLIVEAITPDKAGSELPAIGFKQAVLRGEQ